MNNNTRHVQISIIVPLYNEENNIDILYKKIDATMKSLGRIYEIIFVNDGSEDHTLEKLEAIRRDDVHVNVISLKGNYGQTAALAAGFDFAEGNYVISMDGDLQHDPSEIPKFIKELDNGFDIVSGWRKERVDPFWTRKLPSKIANWMMAKLSGIPLHDFGTTFKGYRIEIVKNICLYAEFHRFIPALVEGLKVKIKEIPIKSLPRQSGSSKYNLKRTFTVAFDLIRIHFLRNYLNRPLQVFGSIGSVLGLTGFCIALYLSYLKFHSHISIMSYRAPLFLLSILLILVGTQLLTMGLLGEILVKLYYKLPNSKIYCIEKCLLSEQRLKRSGNSSDQNI